MENTKLTKSERRIEIVKDAIAQLQAGSYITGQFGYVDLSDKLTEVKSSNGLDQAQDYLEELSKDNKCGVCAKGSLFLSTIRKENDLQLCDLEDNHQILMKKLTSDELFDEYNLNLIEAYYENWNLSIYRTYHGWVVLSCRCHVGVARVGSGFSENEANEMKEKHNKEINEYSIKYPTKECGNRTERLLAILNNMLENDGIFKPI